MGLFDLFKKKINTNNATTKTTTAQPKTYICARCKKEITDNESKWIGNHHFCKNCAALPKSDTINKHLEEAKAAAYQARMDYEKGSLTPEQAYSNRGFVKDSEGKWIYKGIKTDTFVCAKCGKELAKKYIHANNTCVTCATAPKVSSTVQSKSVNSPK